MKITLTFIFAGAVLQANAQFDTYGRSQNTREWQETVRHYESMRKSPANSNTGFPKSASGSYEVPALFKKKTPEQKQQEAEARKKAEEKRIADRKIAWNNNEQYLGELIIARKIYKDGRYYKQLMQAAKESGLPEIWNKRVFGYSDAEFNALRSNSNSTLHKYFPDDDHPLSFTFNDLSEKQIATGQYRVYYSLTGLIKAFIDDGKNNFATVADKTDVPVTSFCSCDESYRVKYYWLNFTSFELGSYSFSTYPFIAFSSWGKTEEEYQNIITYEINSFLATGLYTFYKEEDRFGTSHVLKLKPEYITEKGISYEFHMRIDTRTSVPKLQFSLYKNDAVPEKEKKQTAVVENLQLQPAAPATKKSGNSNPVYNSLQLNEAKTTETSAVIIDAGRVYANIVNTSCLDWSWATTAQKKLSGKTGWGNYKPQKGDKGVIVFTALHCSKKINICILKVGAYYVPVAEEGILKQLK